MSFSDEDLAGRERRRWMRENAHLYIRHDAHRFMRLDALGWSHPDEKLRNLYFRYRAPQPDQARAAPAWSESRAAEYAGRAGADRRRPSLGELLKLKWDAAALRVQLAVIKHEIATRKAQGLPPLTEADAGWQIVLKNLARYQEACRKAGFNPDQPRVPAGNPGGGQWMSGGAGGAGGGASGGGLNDPRVLSDATPDNEWIPGARYAQDESGRYSVVLENEPTFKHISEHIDRSDEELLERLNKNYYRGITVYGFEEAQGSFTDVRSANDLINRTLEDNRNLVDQVASAQQLEMTIEKRFGYSTGKEMYRPDVNSEPYSRVTYAVRLVIRRDEAMKNGYRIVTAFPVNRMRTRRSP